MSTEWSVDVDGQLVAGCGVNWSQRPVSGLVDVQLLMVEMSQAATMTDTQHGDVETGTRRVQLAFHCNTHLTGRLVQHCTTHTHTHIHTHTYTYTRLKTD